MLLYALCDNTNYHVVINYTSQEQAAKQNHPGQVTSQSQKIEDLKRQWPPRPPFVLAPSFKNGVY